jgi:hypothetical protein
VFSHREWLKKKLAADPGYREKLRAAQRAYRQSHMKEIVERRRLRRQSDPAYLERERARERNWRQRKRLESVYGISQEQYEAMVARQGGLCAICNTKPDKTLCVDHCHETGRVRGLLCSSCNSMLGFSKDDPRRLEAGSVYLRAFRNEPAVSRQDKNSAIYDPVVPANAGTQ